MTIPSAVGREALGVEGELFWSLERNRVLLVFTQTLDFAHRSAT